VYSVEGTVHDDSWVFNVEQVNETCVQNRTALLLLFHEQ